MNPPPQFLRGILPILFLLFVVCEIVAASPQAATAPPPQVLSRNPGGIYLVFPFESVNTSPRYEWVGEGLEEWTIQSLSANGQQVYSHEGRLNEMDLYGLPSSARLSRASMLRFAQEMDADWVIFGTFSTDGTTLTVSARILRIDNVALLPEVRESGPLASLIDLQTKVIWRLLVSNDRSYPLSLTEFAKRQRTLRLDAFERYARGMVASDDETRLRELKEAARLEPDWPDPAFELGRIYYSRNDCASAISWLGRVPAANQRHVEAVFATAVCQLQMGQAAKAEEAFSGLQSGLQRNMVSGADLPEILNNVGLAQAREGNWAAAQKDIQRASEIEPDEDDYPFNLGLLALSQNDLIGAIAHFREAAHREPDNAEDRAFLIYALERAGKKTEADEARAAAAADFGDKNLPAVRLDNKGDLLTKYERIRRELDITALRLDLQDPNAQHTLAAVNTGGASVHADSAERLRQGRQELNAGHLDAAEQQFRAVLATDPKNATAHRELGEIDRRRGRLDDAVKELQLSLASRDSAAVRTMLARVYLQQQKPELARAELDKALQLAPNYAEAKELLQHVGKSSVAGGAR